MKHKSQNICCERANGRRKHLRTQLVTKRFYTSSYPFCENVKFSAMLSGGVSLKKRIEEIWEEMINTINENTKKKKYVYMKQPVGIFALGSPRSDKNKQLLLWPRHLFIIIPFRCLFLSFSHKRSQTKVDLHYIHLAFETHQQASVFRRVYIYRILLE